MKSLLTAAILVATSVAANAQTLEQAITKAVDTYIGELAEKGIEPTQHEISGISAQAAQKWYESDVDSDLTAVEEKLDNTQDTADFYQREYAKDEEEIAELEQASVEADAEAIAQAQILGGQLDDALSEITALDTEISTAANKAVVEFGDVYNTGAVNSEYFSKSSYDKGKVWANITPPDFEGGIPFYQNVTSIDVVGKYHNYNIETDMWIRVKGDTKTNFSKLLKDLKNVVYDEAYKDGFNDGYQTGYNDGWHDAIQSLQ